MQACVTFTLSTPPMTEIVKVNLKPNSKLLKITKSDKNIQPQLKVSLKKEKKKSQLDLSFPGQSGHALELCSNSTIKYTNKMELAWVHRLVSMGSPISPCMADMYA